MARRAGFTLIEMLAVVAIFALMAAIVMPNLGLVNRRALRDDARELSAQLELARQRAVVTSIPHRVYLDLEGSSYRMEWLTTEAQANGEEPPAPDDAELDLSAATPLDLSPPAQEQRAYYPLPGMLGRTQDFDDDVFVAGVETPEGRVDRGEAFVAFERDGTATWTTIELENELGDVLLLEVLPLDDIVRVRNAES